MSADFLAWWFDTHYIASTLCTPFLTWMWLLWSDGSIWREIVAAFIALLSAGSSHR